MKNIVEKLWPLPPTEKRKFSSLWIAPRYFKKMVRRERTGDYLCYQAGLLVQYVGVLYLVLMLVDARLGLGLLVDLDALEEKKVVFVVSWAGVIGKFALLVSFLAYLRVRLTVDVKSELIPIFTSKETFQGKAKRECVEYALFFLGVSIVVFAGAQACAGGLIRMYNLENSTSAVAIEQLLAVTAIPIFVPFSISMALVLEKTIRFFPKLQENVENW